MNVKEVIFHIELFAPLSLQESYDNAGLIIGDLQQEVSAVLLTIDTTEAIIDEAIKCGANLIISHHPIIFSGLKKITGRNYIERTVLKAIKNNIAIYAAHTNLDAIKGGVNFKIAEKLGLSNTKILKPVTGELFKLVCFVPQAHADKVRKAIFEAGAGHIGNYDSCSYNVEGIGTFKGNENTNPFVGEKGKLHNEPETRIETIFPKYQKRKVISALLKSHPYEEVAYDIYPLENEFYGAGMGVIGEIKPTDEKEFLKNIKNIFQCKVIKYTQLLNKPINKVALCGGSGSSFLNEAIAHEADIFISGDFKYHQFFDADNKIIIADIGHFESEQFTLEIFYEILTKKIANFAVHLPKMNSNPINYL